MQTINLFRQFNLSWSKAAWIGLMLLAFGTAQGQKKRFIQRNNPTYDDRKFSYGFLIGIHSSALQIDHSEAFNSIDFDTLRSIQPSRSGGFALGLIVNYKVYEFLDLRLTPNVSFFEYNLHYRYTSGLTQIQTMESTMVQFPFLAKYKSARRGNIRMYMVGGFSPGIEASGKKQVEGNTGDLRLQDFNMTVDAGFGFDLYFPLFKFSPEIRFSRGIVNMIGSQAGPYGTPLQRANTNTITLFLLFQ